MLRADSTQLVERIMGGSEDAALRALLEGMVQSTLAAAVRDLGGHDLSLLVDTFAAVDDDRPTVVFAYTIKGRGLPTEGHPNNHSALLSEDQMIALAKACGTELSDPWRPFDSDSVSAQLCTKRAAVLAREPMRPSEPLQIPTSLGHAHRKATSTQATLGRLLTDFIRDVPLASTRVVTCSPDVASSTNLGGWINKTGVWSVFERHDWFSDDKDRLLRWSEAANGQHIEIGIAEVNLVSLLGELGATWSRWGQRLIPIGTLYDPFVSRALEPWSYGMYAGGQSILVGTPSGVTLAPEGGAHQSISTPSIGLEQPGCVAWEPAFGQDLEWTLLHAMNQVGVPGGSSAYFRLSTRPLNPAIARIPEDPALLERRRRQVVAGGYRLTDHDIAEEQVTLVGVGAIMPEVVEAASSLAELGVRAGVICLTSPDLVFRSFQQRGQRDAGAGGDILTMLLPPSDPAPLVTVLDGHPHTLSFLSAARGDRIRCLGVSDFGQSSDLADAYALHGIDTSAIIDAALTLLGR